MTEERLNELEGRIKVSQDAMFIQGKVTNELEEKLEDHIKWSINEERIEKIEKSINDLYIKRSVDSGVLDDIEDRIEKLDASSDSHTERLNLKSDSTVNLHNNLSERISELREDNKQLRGWLITHNDDFDEVDERIAELKKQIKGKRTISVCNYSMDELKEQVFYTPAGLRDDVQEYLAEGLLIKEVLRELFQRMGDNEDLSVVGYDLLSKLGGDSEEDTEEIMLNILKGGEQSGSESKMISVANDKREQDSPDDSKPPNTGSARQTEKRYDCILEGRPTHIKDNEIIVLREGLEWLFEYHPYKGEDKHELKYDKLLEKYLGEKS